MAVLQLSIILYYDTLKILKSGLDKGPIIENYQWKEKEILGMLLPGSLLFVFPDRLV